MARISLPRPFRSSLTALASLDEGTADQLIRDIGQLAPFSAVTEIEQAFRLHMGEEGDAGAVSAALLSLRAQRREMSAHDIADELTRAPGLDLDETGQAALKARVEALLDTAAMSTTSVAVDLQTRHARNFQSARIITDLRPVFEDDPDDGPAGAVIVETLELQTWTRTGDREQIYVALDESDLKQLQGVVGRALKKTEALRRFIDGAGLRYFELEKGDE